LDIGGLRIFFVIDEVLCEGFGHKILDLFLLWKRDALALPLMMKGFVLRIEGRRSVLLRLKELRIEKKK
jgi:hypothetical protein